MEKKEKETIFKQERPEKPAISYILISCCTCKRPKMLEKAIKSIEQLFLPKDIKVEILVCDNDINESGRKTVEEVLKNFKLKINYVVEKERGIASARNRVLNEAVKLNASHILFFDDDEIFEKNCLIKHIEMYENNEQAYISSGLTKNKFADNLPKHVTKNLVFKQRTTKKTGMIRTYCASGNVFFPVSLVKDYDTYFSLEYKFMGGEDGDFFGRASKKGFTIVCNNEAIVYEMISEARGNINWILQKSYYNGYAGTILKFKNSRKSKILYILKQIITLCLNGVFLIFAILSGFTLFLNILCICIRTKGKIDAAIENKTVDFYKNICGE